MQSSRVIVGDNREVLRTLDAGSVQCVVTSPPYWGLRDYKADGQLGLEPTLDEFIENQVAVFREVRRVLRDDGTLWLNMGDGYGGPAGNNRSGFGCPKDRSGTAVCKGRPAMSGTRSKDLLGQPWRLAFALQADGWYLRSDIIWHKPNPMPESVTDRPTKSHEHVFLLTKSARYFYDADAVRVASAFTTLQRDRYTRILENDGPQAVRHDHETPSNPSGRNLRDVWTIPTESFSGAHFATFPRKLVEPCLKAGTSERGACPECGAAWRRVVERQPMRVDNSARLATRDPAESRTACSGTMTQPPSSHTTGWRPGCECDKTGHKPYCCCWLRGDSPLARCLTLDPYCGSGTTGVVAKQLGLDFIGIELNPDYAEMARKRIENPEPLPEVPDAKGQVKFDW